jgi:GTPase SAR1 family protein
MFIKRHSMSLIERLKNLENHLQEEHPDLLQVLPTYRQMDKILNRIGLLDGDSLATRITWWPLISVLGTFSSGKSTFINSVIGESLQKTGNQAVDDKFTVICYSHHDESRTLPGTALNNDPRFPFYRIGAEVEKVSSGEGRRIDTYLQLKTSSKQSLKGRTFIDSPGFDADDQRRSTLRLTNHIIDISDLVLIFFDARHPEPGAMQDTLEHLVKTALGRVDSNKFLYILNQIDTTAREDNPEEVVAAWQRAMAETGMTGGRFLCIYDEEAAVPIDDPALRERYQRKRDADLSEITNRISDVDLERGYRIISSLEDVAKRLEHDVIPLIENALARWRKLTIIGDIVGLGVAGGLAYGAINLFGIDALQLAFDSIRGYVVGIIALAVAVGTGIISWHFAARNWAAGFVTKTLSEHFGDQELNLRSAFIKSIKPWRSVFSPSVAGWGKSTKGILHNIQGAIEGHIQRLNDQHTDPSGRKRAIVVAENEAKANLQVVHGDGEG